MGTPTMKIEIKDISKNALLNFSIFKSWLRRKDSNLRPRDNESRKLPLLYSAIWSTIPESNRHSLLGRQMY